MITLADVIAFIKTADEVDKGCIRGALNMSYVPPTNGYNTDHLNRYNFNKQARATQAAQVLGKLGVGDMVSFPYNGVNYKGQVTKINRTKAKVRITEMDAPPTKKDVVVGAVVGVDASILARGK
jgi:hypothetical protein